MIVFNHLPVQPLRVTSKFGLRKTGISGASTNHKGIDLGKNWSIRKTPVFAVAAGTIKSNYWNNYRGWVVIIDHGNFETLYQHLEKQSNLRKGAKIVAGQQIGIMGKSSNKKKLLISAHLHFELIVNGLQVDPQPYLENIKEIEEMTKEDVIAIIKEVLAGSEETPSGWAKERWEQSVADGIVVGTGPKKYTTKEEVVSMIQLSKSKGNNLDEIERKIENEN